MIDATVAPKVGFISPFGTTVASIISTPRVRRAGKRERGTSGRCTASVANPCSARILARTPGSLSCCSQRAAQTTDSAP